MRTRVTLWFKGFLWLLFGAGGIGFGLGIGETVLVVIGLPALLYGVVLIVQDRMVRGQVELSAEEITKWGPRLSEGTPEILALLADGATPAEVSQNMLKARGLPQEITLRYIVALGVYQKEQVEKR